MTGSAIARLSHTYVCALAVRAWTATRVGKRQMCVVLYLQSSRRAVERLNGRDIVIAVWHRPCGFKIIGCAAASS